MNYADNRYGSLGSQSDYLPPNTLVAYITIYMIYIRTNNVNTSGEMVYLFTTILCKYFMSDVIR